MHIQFFFLRQCLMFCVKNVLNVDYFLLLRVLFMVKLM